MTEEEGISWVPSAWRHYHNQLHLVAWVWVSLLLLGLAAWAGLGYQVCLTLGSSNVVLYQC